jgi:CheY-like chemotaxis protein
VINTLISVIDDDEAIRRTTTFLIESFGFRAAAFESAEDFLNSVELHDTSCLLIDVRLPGMNGLQLQSELAAARCDIPIIFITAYENSDSRRQGMQAGAVAFLAKPFNDEELLQGIRSALRGGNDATKSLISVIDDNESVRRTHFSSSPLAFERQPLNLPRVFLSLANCTILHALSWTYRCQA